MKLFGTIGTYLFGCIFLALTKVKLFRDSDELQHYQYSKFSIETGAKRELEKNLSNLNGLLGRSHDIDQIDSEESAEIFQLRDITRQRRSPKRSKEKKSREKNSKEKKS